MPANNLPSTKKIIPIQKAGTCANAITITKSEIEVVVGRRRAVAYLHWQLSKLVVPLVNSSKLLTFAL